MKHCGWLHDLYLHHIGGAGHTDRYAGGDDGQVAGLQKFQLHGCLDGLVKKVEDFLFFLDDDGGNTPG